MKAKIICILVAVLIGAVRPFLETHHASASGSYEAIAHLFVGGLFGAWAVGGDRVWLYLGIGLSALEVICAVATRV